MNYKRHTSVLSAALEYGTRLKYLATRGNYRHGQKVRTFQTKHIFAVAAFILIATSGVVVARRDDSANLVAQSDQPSTAAESFATEGSNDYTQFSLTQPITAWPEVGYSAVGVIGNGVLAASHPEDTTPRPMASLAKVMTSLALLDKNPISVGESGPSISITETDLTIYNEYIARNGSVLPVEVGQQFDLNSVIQALMIRSANNFADTAVNWAFGSVDAYLDEANKMAAEFGLFNTNFDDATGFSPESKSTPSDLVLLADRAIQNPVIAEAARTWTTEIEGIGAIYNTNNFLDFEGNGVIGLKTGDTDEAGGTYMVAARRVIDGEEAILLAVVLSGESHFSAQQTAMPLIEDLATKLRAKN